MAKRAMGKGLSAILGEEIAKVNKVTDAGAEKLVGQVAMISLDAIDIDKTTRLKINVFFIVLNFFIISII